MERKFHFKRIGKSSSDTSTNSETSILSNNSLNTTNTSTYKNSQQNSFLTKKNDENFIKSSSASTLLSTYTSGNIEYPIKEHNKVESALISNLENQDQTKFYKTSNNQNNKPQSVHPIFAKKTSILQFDEDAEQDFIKPPQKKFNQPKQQSPKKPLHQQTNSSSIASFFKKEDQLTVVNDTPDRKKKAVTQIIVDSPKQKPFKKVEARKLFVSNSPENSYVIPDSPEQKPEIKSVILKSPVVHDSPKNKVETIQEPEIDHKEICPSCKCKYTHSGSKRRLIDACDHGACFGCIMKQTPCVICVKTKKTTDQTEDDFLKESGLSYEELQSILNSPEKKPDIEVIPDSPVLVSTNKKTFDSNTDDELDDLKPAKVKSSAFKIVEKVSNQFDKSKSDDIEILELDKDFKSVNNTSTQMPGQVAIKKNLNDFEDDEVGDGVGDDDEDLCVIDDFDFESTDSKNMNSQNGTITNGVFIPDVEKYEKIIWLFNDIKDCSSQFRSIEYNHTDEMLNKFRILFGLKHFRPQQFEAINAAVLGWNVFILMPTGGGKSLCYQLPAVVSKGVTFVVSPLKSLIIDQVQKLIGLGVSACHMLSDVDSTECDSVYQELVKQEPRFKLIYITPEKLNNSNKLRNVILNLYNRGMISRLVIDEAHCVSQWGHDFRTDYKKMGEMRYTLMPNVPCMLLTATATPRVRNDILMQMKLTMSESAMLTNGLTGFKTAFGTSGVQSNQMNKLENKLNNRNYMSVSSNSLPTNNQKCVFFMQSFNRENLQYKVEYKTSNSAALEKIGDLIKSKYANKSGIVYCISRNECEQVSEFLRKKQIKALPYHAGMDDKKRQQIQHKWTNNIDCKVVCATIAFGMGIDKPDVRYVVHLGLPKSLEGYYQESGRAGRDGAVSLCLLFYNNQDRHKWLRLMQHEQKGPNFNPAAYKTHVDNIYRMAQYCDNRTDCRRAQILEYFGEKFDRRKCIESKMKTICDNCELQVSNQYTIVDITSDSTVICKGIQQLSNKDDITLLHLSEVLKGSMNSKVTEKGHQNLEMHGKLSKYKKNDIERIVRKLIFMGFLKEDVKVLQHSETVASYIKIGPRASQLFSNSNTRIDFELIEDESKPSKPKKCKVVDSDSESSGDDEKGNSKKSKKPVKLSDSTAINRLLLRCQTDIKTLIKRVCNEKGVKNMGTLFTPKMLSEMLIRLPETKEEMLGITGYTESVFNNYKGDEFLTIFKHYAKSRREIQQEELQKMEQIQIEKAKARAVQSQASYKNSKTYGLIDDTEVVETDYNSTKWMNSKAGSSYSDSSAKRKNNYTKSYPANNKKAKTSSYGGDCSDGESKTGANSSSYFNSNKKKFTFKNKSKFKNYKKKY